MNQRKDEQAFVEGRISTLEKMIRFAEIIDDNNVEKMLLH